MAKTKRPQREPLTPLAALRKRYASLVKRWERELSEENSRHASEVKRISEKLSAHKMVYESLNGK